MSVYSRRTSTSPRAVGTPNDRAYWLGPNGRAMVSLGPLKTANYCTYSCPFCYVQGPFQRYQQGASVEEIVAWLEARRQNFTVVYISGDTDSFATPRTDQALDLLDALVALDVDVLFTTRHVFDSSARTRLSCIAESYRSRQRLLIGCVSVSQWNDPSLEPVPIATPTERLNQLAWFQTVGIISVLTIRPFIPAIEASDYATIARHGIDTCDLVLGSHWYVDPAGLILSQTEAALGRTIDKQSEITVLDYTPGTERWHVFKHPSAEAAVLEVCRDAGRPFFMRSDPAIAHLRHLVR